MLRLRLTGPMLNPPRLCNQRRLVAHFALLADRAHFQVVAVDQMARGLLQRNWERRGYVHVEGKLGLDTSQGAVRWLVYPTLVQRAINEVDSCQLRLRGWVSHHPQTFEGKTQFPLLLDDAQLLATYYVLSHGRIGEAVQSLKLRPRDYVEVPGQPRVRLWHNYRRHVCVRYLIYPQFVRRLERSATHG